MSDGIVDIIDWLLEGFDIDEDVPTTADPETL